MTKKQKVISLILLLIAALLATIVAGTSVSRYVFEQNDNMSGSFTTLFFSHNGEGSTAIMEEDGGSYVGYTPLTAYNYIGDNISARKIEYNIRALKPADVKDGDHIEDAWGTVTPLEDSTAIANSYNYTVSYDSTVSTGENENLPLGSDVGSGVQPERASRTDLLKITRTEGGNLSTTPEAFYIVIEVVKPYSAVYVFKINASTSLISVGATSPVNPGQHFGYDQMEVRVQTSRSYQYDHVRNNATKTITSSSPAKITLSWTSDEGVIFDSGRFAQLTENNLKELTSLPGNNDGWPNGWHAVTGTEAGKSTLTLTLFLPRSSDVTLYFYVPSSYDCKVTAQFLNDDDKVLYDYNEIAGLLSDNTLVSIQK